MCFSTTLVLWCNQTDLSTDEARFAINAISSQAITAEEASIGNFTRPKLKKLNTWPLWEAGEHKQLNHFENLQMHGKPVARPKDAIVLHPHWQCQIKRDGARRSRNCCDGSPRSAPALKGVASTCSSCVEQPAQRMFFCPGCFNGMQSMWRRCSWCMCSFSTSGWPWPSPVPPSPVP